MKRNESPSSNGKAPTPNVKFTYFSPTNKPTLVLPQRTVDSSEEKSGSSLVDSQKPRSFPIFEKKLGKTAGTDKAFSQKKGLTLVKREITLNPVLVYNKNAELQESEEIFIIGGLECISNGLCIYKDNKGEFHILKQRQDRIIVNRDSPLSKSYDNNVMFYTETKENFFSKEQVIKQDNEKADSFALKLAANQVTPLSLLSFNINDKISVKDAKINIDGYYYTINKDNNFVKGDKAQYRSIKHIPNLMEIALLWDTESGKTEYRLNIIAKTNPESSFFLGPVLETSKVLNSTHKDPRDPQIILEGLEDLGDCSFSCGSPLLKKQENIIGAELQKNDLKIHNLKGSFNKKNNNIIETDRTRATARALFNSPEKKPDSVLTNVTGLNFDAQRSEVFSQSNNKITFIYSPGVSPESPIGIRPFDEMIKLNSNSSQLRHK